MQKFLEKFSRKKDCCLLTVRWRFCFSGLFVVKLLKIVYQTFLQSRSYFVLWNRIRVNVMHLFGDWGIQNLFHSTKPGFLKIGSRHRLWSRSVILGSRNKWLDKSDITIFVNFIRKLKEACSECTSITFLEAISCFSCCQQFTRMSSRNFKW